MDEMTQAVVVNWLNVKFSDDLDGDDWLDAYYALEELLENVTIEGWPDVDMDHLLMFARAFVAA